MRRLSLAFAVTAGFAALAPFAQAREESPAPAPAPAAAPAPAVTAPAKPAADDPNRIVCTREHVVGSNRPQKVCMTVAQREELKAAADRSLDPTRRRAGGQDIPGSAGM